MSRDLHIINYLIAFTLNYTVLHVIYYCLILEWAAGQVRSCGRLLRSLFVRNFLSVIVRMARGARWLGFLHLSILTFSRPFSVSRSINWSLDCTTLRWLLRLKGQFHLLTDFVFVDWDATAMGAYILVSRVLTINVIIVMGNNIQPIYICTRS